MLVAGDTHPLVVMTMLHRHYRQVLRLDGAGVTSADEAAALLGLRSAYPAKKALAQVARLGVGPDRPGHPAAGRRPTSTSGGSPPCPGEAVLEVLVARLSRLVRQGR